MTAYYVDPINGDDSRTGTTWALAWRTLKLGATSLRLASGDEVRVGKTEDPVSIGQASWTDRSQTMILPAGLTKDVDLCESGWIASTDITVTFPTGSTRKQGNTRLNIVVGANFTTGKMAYKALGSAQDFSAYQQLSFWFALAAGTMSVSTFKVCLCSDATGDVIVDEFVVPIYDTSFAANWIPFTVNKGSTLGSSIQSVAIYAIVDPVTATIYFDMMFACKAPGDGCINLNMLVSKNSLARGGDEPWMPIQSIVGTTLTFDWFYSWPGYTTTSEGYCGVTETVESYTRQTIRPLKTDSNTLNRSGTGDLGSLRVYYYGGWDPDINRFSGYTCFDNTIYGMQITGINYIDIQGFILTRCVTGIYFTTSSSYVNLILQTVAGCSGANASLATHHSNIDITNLVHGNLSNLNLLAVANYGSHNNVVGRLFAATAEYNLILGGTTDIITVDTLKSAKIACLRIYGACNARVFVNHIEYGAVGVLIASYKNIIHGARFANNTKDIYSSCVHGQAVFRNCTFTNAEADWRKIDSSYPGHCNLEKIGGDPNVNIIFGEGYKLESQTAVRRSSSGIAWKLTLEDLHHALYPARIVIAVAQVSADSEVTASIWTWITAGAGIAVKFVCPGRQIPGVLDDVTATRTSTDGVWERLSISFTPIQAGDVQLELWAGNNNGQVYFDDFDIVQG